MVAARSERNAERRLPPGPGAQARPLSGHAVAFATVAAMTLSCILPDSGIVVREENLNQHAVRFVEPTGLTAAARCACDPVTCDALQGGEMVVPVCPLPPSSGVPRVLEPSAYPFCICPEGQEDTLALSGFELFVEDQDEVDGEPKDTLYAALLLDADAADDPTKKVAYLAYLNPNLPLPRAIAVYAPLFRPTPLLRRVVIGDVDGIIDLCNGASLSVGTHVLTVIVTDRPWFSTTAAATGDEPGVTVVQIGVPDLAGGATYDTLDFVFTCSDSSSEAVCGAACQEATQ